MRFRMFATLGLLAPMLLGAQTTGTVQGTVTDAGNGQPLASAQVRIEGTVMGALSDATGRYTIPNVPTGRRVVIARRIGYGEARRQVDVSSEAPVTADFSMTASATTLGEVVVTGTAAPTERRAVGTSIASVDSTAISKSNAVTVDQALQGKIAGAQIVQNSGTPGGGGVTVRLRGTSSFISGSDPLYIVDGVIIDNSSSTLRDLGSRGNVQNRLADLNPADIDRIEVIRGGALRLTRQQRGGPDLYQARDRRTLAHQPAHARGAEPAPHQAAHQ
jgi:TonB-dependent starch-binding outer membrane protein SusC